MKNHFFFLVRHKYKLTRHKIFAFFFSLYAHNTTLTNNYRHFYICKETIPTEPYLRFLHTQRNNTNRSLLTFLDTQKKEYQSNTFLHMQRNNTNQPLLTFLHTQRNYTNKSQLTIKPHKTYPSHFSMKNHFFLFGNEYKLTEHKIFTLFFSLYAHNTTPTNNYIRFYMCKETIPTNPYLHFHIRKGTIPTSVN
jgi:hypothetical protein